MACPRDWGLIKSDPRIFTELIMRLGVRGVQVEELWTMNSEVLDNLRPIHGFIHILKNMHQVEALNPVIRVEQMKNIYFAKQIFYNVRATLALVNLLLNCYHPDVKIGSTLTKFKENTMPFDPLMRGLALCNTQAICSAQNSMAQPASCFEHNPRTTTYEQEVRFIGYMPINGRLYEFDGLRERPIDHGPTAPGQDWHDVVRHIITSRINTGRIIHISLMALISDRKMVYNRKIDKLLNNNQGMSEDDMEKEIRDLVMLIRYNKECTTSRRQA